MLIKRVGAPVSLLFKTVGVEGIYESTKFVLIHKNGTEVGRAKLDFVFTNTKIIPYDEWTHCDCERTRRILEEKEPFIINAYASKAPDYPLVKDGSSLNLRCASNKQLYKKYGPKVAMKVREAYEKTLIPLYL